MDIGIRTRARTILARFESTRAPEPPPGTAKAGKPILVATTGTVAAVATFAAIQSYSHIYWLGSTHRQDQLDSALLPLTVDGLITAASLVLLFASITRHRAPWLARVALWLGIAVTVAANVAFGIPAGMVGALVSAWPALAFVLAVELLMRLVRLVRSATPSERTPAVLPGAPATATALTAAAPARAPGIPESAHHEEPDAHRAPAKVRTARPRTAAPRETPTAEALAAHFGAEQPSENAIMSAFHVGRPLAKQLRAAYPMPELIPAVNGTPVEGSQ
jgi:Protein of unknown function (DUF2637)